MADLNLSLSPNGLPKSLTPWLRIQVSFQVWHFLLLPGKNKTYIQNQKAKWQNDKICRIYYVLLAWNTWTNIRNTHTHTAIDSPPKSTPFWPQKSYLVVVVGVENFSSSKPPSNINLHKNSKIKMTLQSTFEVHKMIHTYTPMPNSLYATLPLAARANHNKKEIQLLKFCSLRST